MPYPVDMAQTPGPAAVTTTAMNMPSHQAGDLLIAFITADTGTVTVTTGTWSAVPSAPANPVSQGIVTYLFYRLATSSNDLLSITTTDSFTCGVYCIRDVDQTTPFDGVTPIRQGVAVATSLPTFVGAAAVTTNSADAMAMWFIASEQTQNNATMPQILSDPGNWQWFDGFDSTGTNATTSAQQCACWQIIRTSGASIPQPTFVSNLSEVYVRTALVIRNSSGGRVPAYINGTPGLRLYHGHYSGTLNNTTITGTLTTTTSINSKTVTGSTPTLGLDYGINPYASAMGKTSAIVAATALSGSEVQLTGGRNLSTGLLVGSLIAISPKAGTFGIGSIAQGGVVARVGSGASNWEAYQIAAKNTTVTTENRYVFAIQPGYTGSDYGTPGSATNTSAVTFVQILLNCPAFASIVYLSEMHRADTHIVAGGTTANPVDLQGLASVGKSFRIPLIQQTGSSLLSFVPIQIGGSDAVIFNVDSSAIQFPQRANTTAREIAYHAADDRIGIDFAGKSGDSIKLTSSIITSKTPYYFSINAAATSACNWDFSGLSIIGANVSLRPVTTFFNMNFTSFTRVAANGCTMNSCSFSIPPATSNSIVANTTSVFTQCEFDTTTITAGNALFQIADPSIINNSTFTGNTSSGHAIELTTAAAGQSFTLTNVNFNSYGANGSTSAAIYNNSAGAVTLTISGGAPPTIRNGTSASTTLVLTPRVFSISNVIENSEVRIYNSSLTELAGVENVSASPTGLNNVTVASDVDNPGRFKVSYTYQYSTNTPIIVVIFAISHKDIRLSNLTLTDADQNVLVQQQIDRVYST